MGPGHPVELARHAQPKRRELFDRSPFAVPGPALASCNWSASPEGRRTASTFRGYRAGQFVQLLPNDCGSSARFVGETCCGSVIRCGPCSAPSPDDNAHAWQITRSHGPVTVLVRFVRAGKQRRGAAVLGNSRSRRLQHELWAATLPSRHATAQSQATIHGTPSSSSTSQVGWAIPTMLPWAT
jgi:hypothetical protein